MLAIPQVELSKIGTETESQAIARINAEIEAKYKAIEKCVISFIKEKRISAYQHKYAKRTLFFSSLISQKEISQIKSFLKKCGAKKISVSKKYNTITF